MEQFLTYFPSAFSWGNLAVLILGSAGGLFFGAMPGLSPTMAVALLVPFTFYLPADTSLILLGAVYTSAVAGGSISAILLSIPGAPSSIATLFDGYPMAKQGRAQEALYTVFVSSLIGGVFGVLVMILFSPPMAEFAMRFGPSELFWTAIFGITVITGLSSGAMLKGLFGGALGMLLSTVGYSTLTGEPRFVIHEALNGGIALLPEAKEDPEGEHGELYIMGEYCNDMMGKYINLYYGSFAALAGQEDWTEEDWEDELYTTLAHEFTHHIEGRAGERGLERKDEQFMEEFRAGRGE